MKWNDEILIHAVQTSYSYRQVAIKIGLCENGRDGYRAFKRRMRELELSTQHFVSCGVRTQFAKPYKHMSIEELLRDCKLSKTIKARLIKDGILIKKCAECGIGSEWNGKALTLQLDHIDGNSENNALENLRLLCPNCHTQTPTYGSKKLKKVKVKTEINKIYKPRLVLRKVERPSKEELISLIKSKPMTAIGVQYGVSDNAVRKWAMSYDIDFKKIRKTT